MTPTTTLTGERADLLESLGKARFFLKYTAQNLTDEQAAARSTKSELCVGGLIKHVTAVEQQWTRFITEGTEAVAVAMDDPDAFKDYALGFQMADGETLASLVAAYDEVAARTDELVRTWPSLDDGHALPPAPWFQPGARWSARRVFQHIIAETAQHAGHADIVREAIDGAKSMG